MKMNIEQLKKVFEKNGHKFTKQRQIIFNALKNSNSKHLNLQEVLVFGIMNANDPTALLQGSVH